MFVLHRHPLTLLLLLLIPPLRQHPRSLRASQEIAEYGGRGIVAVDSVVVSTVSIVVVAAQAERVDEHLVGLRLVGLELGEEVDEVGVRRGKRGGGVGISCGRSWTCRLMLRLVSCLTFCRANREQFMARERVATIPLTKLWSSMSPSGSGHISSSPSQWTVRPQTCLQRLDHNRFPDTSPFAQREVVDLHILSSEEEPREKGEDAEENVGKVQERVWKSFGKGWQKVGKRLAKGWEELGEGLGKAWEKFGKSLAPPSLLRAPEATIEWIQYGLFGPENMF
jgi:hypothetical protein